MKFVHFSVVCADEEKSDTFYQDILGLKKIKTSLIPAEVINKISDINKETKLILYGNDNYKAEVFIVENYNRKRTLMNHVCIEVSDRKSFIDKCESLRLNIFKIPKGEIILYFLTDFDNNLFEIK